jgi:hypothetical protein
VSFLLKFTFSVAVSEGAFLRPLACKRICFFRGRFGGEVPGGEFRKSKEAGHYSGLFNNNR